MYYINFNNHILRYTLTFAIVGLTDAAPYLEMLKLFRSKRATSTCSQVANCNTCSNPPLQCAACSIGQVLAADRMSCLS